MLVLMPKYLYYTAMEDNHIYSANDFIKKIAEKYIKELPDILVEDRLAMEVFPEKHLMSVTHERDVKSVRLYEALGDYSNTAMDYRNSATVPNYIVQNTYNNIPVMMSDFDKYKKEWSSSYFELAKEAVQRTARRQKVCIVFTGNKSSRMKITPQPEENDGILYIMPSLETKTTEYYYTGMWVKEEVADKIIGGIYGT